MGRRAAREHEKTTRRRTDVAEKNAKNVQKKILCILRWRRTGCDNVAPAHCCSLWLQHGPAAILYVPRRHRAGMGARHGTTRSVGILSLITSPRGGAVGEHAGCVYACTLHAMGIGATMLSVHGTCQKTQHRGWSEDAPEERKRGKGGKQPKKV